MPDLPSALVFAGVDEKTIAELEMEFDSGVSISGSAIVLTMMVVDVETKERHSLDFVIPRSMGADLLVNLLTDSQWDAVCSADD